MRTLIPGLFLILYPVTASILCSFYPLSIPIKLALIFGLYPWIFVNIYYSLFSTEGIQSVIGFIILYLLFAAIIATALFGFTLNVIFLWLSSWKMIALLGLHLATAILNAVGFFVFVFLSFFWNLTIETLGLLVLNCILATGSWGIARLIYGV